MSLIARHCCDHSLSFEKDIPFKITNNEIFYLYVTDLNVQRKIDKEIEFQCALLDRKVLK